MKEIQKFAETVIGNKTGTFEGYDTSNIAMERARDDTKQEGLQNITYLFASGGALTSVTADAPP